MKLNITAKDLSVLSDSQKLRLREIWMPKVNQLACASICVDVETEEYEDVTFVIGEVLLMESNGDKKKMDDTESITLYSNHTMFLQRYRLLENESTNPSSNPVDELNSEVLENEFEEFEDEYEENDEESQSEYDDEYEVSEDELCEEDFFSKDLCLPLFSIGELINILIKVKNGNSSFNIGIPAFNNGLDEMYTVSDSFGDSVEGAELCDILWGLLKEKL